MNTSTLATQDHPGAEPFGTIPASQLPAITGGFLYPGDGPPSPSSPQQIMVPLNRQPLDPGMCPDTRGRRIRPDPDPGISLHPRGRVERVLGPKAL